MDTVVQNEKWFTVDDVDDLQSGDIVETISKLPPHSPVCPGLRIPFILHYGIVICQNNVKSLVHNVIGRGPMITPIDEIFTDRTIHRVFRTEMTDCQITNKYNQFKERPYRPIGFNCETLILFIYGRNVTRLQVQIYAVTLLILVVLILVILLLRK